MWKAQCSTFAECKEKQAEFKKYFDSAEASKKLVPKDYNVTSITAGCKPALDATGKCPAFVNHPSFAQPDYTNGNITSYTWYEPWYGPDGKTYFDSNCIIFGEDCKDDKKDAAAGAGKKCAKNSDCPVVTVSGIPIQILCLNGKCATPKGK